jgi:hypothetical protein
MCFLLQNLKTYRAGSLGLAGLEKFDGFRINEPIPDQAPLFETGLTFITWT